MPVSTPNSTAVGSNGKVCEQKKIQHRQKNRCYASMKIKGKPSKQSLVARGLGVGIDQQLKRPISDHKALKSTLKPPLQPDYSLYSTDSETDQVPKMHNRLDRCASLLSNILSEGDKGPPNKKSSVRTRQKSKKGTPKKKVKIILPPTTENEQDTRSHGKRKTEHNYEVHRPIYNERLVSSTPRPKETDEIAGCDLSKKQQELHAQISQIDEEQSLLQAQYSQMLRNHFPGLNVVDTDQNSEDYVLSSTSNGTRHKQLDPVLEKSLNSATGHSNMPQDSNQSDNSQKRFDHEESSDIDRMQSSVFQELENTVLKISEKLSVPRNMSASFETNSDKIDTPTSRTDIYYDIPESNILQDGINIAQYSGSVLTTETDRRPDNEEFSDKLEPTNLVRVDKLPPVSKIYTDTLSKFTGIESYDQVGSARKIQFNGSKPYSASQNMSLKTGKSLEKDSDEDDLIQNPSTTGQEVTGRNIPGITPSSMLHESTNTNNVRASENDSACLKSTQAGHKLSTKFAVNHSRNEEVSHKLQGPRIHISGRGGRDDRNREVSIQRSLQPSCASTQVKALEYLFKELKVILGDERSLEVERLLTEIEYIIGLLPFIISNLNPKFQNEIQLAMQPIRMENSDLRRQLRIANQKAKDLEHSVEKLEEKVQFAEASSIDRQQLENLKSQLALEEQDRRSLTRNVQEVSKVVEELKSENKSLLERLTAKDKEALVKSQELQEEKNRLISELEDWKYKTEVNQTHVQVAEKEKNILKLSLGQSEQEVTRLKALNRDLQDSVARLLDDITSRRRKIDMASDRRNDLYSDFERTRKPGVTSTISKVNEYLKSHQTVTRDNADQLKNHEPASKPVMLHPKSYQPRVGSAYTLRDHHVGFKNDTAPVSDGNSELSSITDLSFSTLSTMTCDENEFQLELANLDADIIKLQDALNAAKNSC